MNSNYETIESSTLLNQETAEVEKVSFSKFSRAAFATGALLTLASVAFLAADMKPVASALSAVSNLQASGLAVCDNIYVDGVTTHAAADGCVLLSAFDLYDKVGSSEKGKKNIGSPYKAFCKKSGELKLTSKDLEYYGLLEDGKSLLSGVVPGKGVSVTLYSGADFDGESLVVEHVKHGQLPYNSFESGTSPNDNVYSLVISVDSGLDFAGPSCGQSVQVCRALVKGKYTKKAPEDGCFLLTAQDYATRKGKDEHYTKGVRFCASKDIDWVNVDYFALRTAGVIHLAGDKKSQVSLIKLGKKVEIVEYEGKHLEGTHAAKSGNLVTKKFDNVNDLINDNVNSLKFKSGAYAVPSSCTLSPEDKSQ